MNSLPTREQILNWIAENPDQTGLREIARAFGMKGASRPVLKELLREMEAEGILTPRRARKARDLPPVAVLRVLAPDASGDIFAVPDEERLKDHPARILLVLGKGDAVPGAGDRVLAKLAPIRGPDSDYQARPIRILGGPGAERRRVLGIFRTGPEGGRIQPIERGADREWMVPREGCNDAKDGELVEAEETGGPRLGLPRARIIARLGDPWAPKSISLIAIHQHGIPDRFPDAVIAEADRMEPPTAGRSDLRDLPLLTIDPVDARDRDDAVCALADDSPANPGGFVVWVAIADVAHFVRPGSELDREARKRGNSTYFPDRVVPMLPDRLSGDLCSLHEGVERSVMAVRMVLDAGGQKIAHEFKRGIMRSRASLNYEQAQAAFEGRHDAATEPLAAPLATLHAAWRATLPAREARQPLDLDLPERRIVLSPEGQVEGVAFKDRLDAHRLIEEFMVLANVAAAEELITRRRPLLFRVHEEPSPEKLEALREIAESAGLVLAKGQVLHTRHLNRLLAQAEGTDVDELINMSTLRAMTQAYYGPDNLGHFGLALRNYAHFTSPIRRYADLVVHRALITAHGFGADGLSAGDIDALEETGRLISEAERRSMAAERETTDRYLAAFMADRIGTELPGRIAGVARFGLFVKLDETGADGLIPIRTLGDEFFRHDPDSQTLTGSRSGMVIGLGQRVRVKLAEAEPVTGGLLLELLELDGAALSRPKGAKSRKRTTAAGRAARAKVRRKADRRG